MKIRNILIQQRFGKGIYFIVGLITFAVLGVISVVPMLLGNEITDENGEPLHPIIIALICIMFFLVLMTYIPSIIVFFKHLLSNGRYAYKVSENGIHDTVIFLNVLAFVFIVPVRFIPWSAVSYADKTEGSVYIRVKNKQVDTSFVGRLLIGIIGYDLCNSCIAKKISEEQAEMILSYCPCEARNLSEDHEA